MPTYQTPNVDHNLYKPILPQTNVGQVFELMSAKQNIYNQNLAKINSQVSSMNDLSSSVSNEFVKQKIDKFNTVANNSLKKYANLDFSIQDNAKLVDNLYDPLVKDADFLADYSATSHYTSEVQKALKFKDATKKEERDAFALTNLEYVTGQVDYLRTAKNPKELKQAAANVKERYYTSYTDYRAHLETAIKDYNLKIERSHVGNGYITKKTNMGEDDYMSLQKYLDTTLSEKDREQMKIEATVEVDKMTRFDGKEKLAGEYVNNTLTSSDKLINESSRLLDDINNKIELLPPIDSQNNKQKQEYKALTDYAEYYSNKIKKINSRKDSFTKLRDNMKNETFNYDDVMGMVIDDITDNKRDSLVHELATSYTEGHQFEDINSDPTYIANQRLTLDYAKLDQDRLEHRDDMTNNHLNRVKDYLIAGIPVDENGNPIIGGNGGVRGTESYVDEDPLSNITSVINEGQLSPKDMEAYKKEMVNAYVRQNGVVPTDWKAHVLGSINREEVWFSPEQKKIRETYLGKLNSKRGDAEMARQELQTHIDAYNKVHKTKLRINAAGNDVEDATGDEGILMLDWGPLTSLWKAGQIIANPMFSAYESAFSPRGLGEVYNENYHDIVSLLHVEDFKKDFALTYKGAYSAGITNTNSIPATKAGRNIYNATIANTFDSFYKSNPTADKAGLYEYNKGVNTDMLDEAYSHLNGLSGNQEALPHTITGRMKGGVAMQFPNIEWKDMYPNIKMEDATTTQLGAFDLVRNKNIRVPLPVEYAQVNQRRANIFGGTPSPYKDYITSMDGHGEAYIKPTKGNYHYIANNSQGGSFKIKPTTNGYELVSSKRAVNIGSFEGVDDVSKIEQFNYIKGNAETNTFKTKLSEIIEKNKKNLHDEGDGTFSLPTSVEKQITNLLLD